MSKSNLLSTLIGVAAGAVAVAGYHKASSLQDEIRKPKAPIVETPSTDAIEEQVRRLETRVAILERTARSTPRDLAPPSPAPAAEPAEPAADAGHHDETEPLPKEREGLEHRKQRVSATVDAFWRLWGTKHGLTAAQSEGLAAIQVDAAKHKLDNQERMTEREMTQAAVRADNKVVNEDVRRKAQALLTPEQFAQFDADKGAEWGSSYRKVRDANAKMVATPP